MKEDEMFLFLPHWGGTLGRVHTEGGLHPCGWQCWAGGEPGRHCRPQSVLRRQRPTNRSPRVFSILSNWMGNGNENSGINSMLTEDQITENRRCLSNSARTLSVIVIMYIVCNIPRLLLNLTEYLYRFQLYQNFSQCGCTNKVWLEVTLWLSRFLLTVNSSVNFIIYWSVGKKFKSTLREIFTKIRCSFSITPNNENVEFI